MQPEHIAPALLQETFHERRFVVAMFVVVNIAMVAAGLLVPHGFVATTSILVEDKNIVQPLMQGAAVPTDVTERSKNAREVMFGRKILDQIFEIGRWQQPGQTAQDRDQILEAIKKRTTITQVARNIIKLDYRDTDAERAFQIARKFAELFIQESVSAKRAESSSAFDFIDKQTDEYHAKLVETEDKLRVLRTANLDARAGTEAEVTARLNQLQSQLERLMQELREAEVKGTALEKQLSGEVVAAVAASRETQYRARIGELQSKLDVLRLSYYDTHPDIVQLKQQIAEVKENIAAEHERREQLRQSGGAGTDSAAMNSPVYQQMRRDLSQNQVSIEALKSRIADTQHRIQQELSRGKLLHEGDARLAELTRDYQVNRDIYQDLLRRRENARVSMNLDSERQGLTLKVLEPAVLPQRPIGLLFWQYVAAGIVLGLLLPVGLLFARMQLDPRVRSAPVLSATLKVPVVATVPHMWSPRERHELRWELAILALVVLAVVAGSAALTVLKIVRMI
jgi:polysaccharide chain length determinant protein (PEP-CTERM system associated)